MLTSCVSNVCAARLIRCFLISCFLTSRYILFATDYFPLVLIFIYGSSHFVLLIRAQLWRLILQNDILTCSQWLWARIMFITSNILMLLMPRRLIELSDCFLMARFNRHTKIKDVTHVPDSFPLYACTSFIWCTEDKAREKDFVLGDCPVDLWWIYDFVDAFFILPWFLFLS